MEHVNIIGSTDLEAYEPTDTPAGIAVYAAISVEQFKPTRTLLALLLPTNTSYVTVYELGEGYGPFSEMFQDGAQAQLIALEIRGEDTESISKVYFEELNNLLLDPSLIVEILEELPQKYRQAGLVTQE